MPPKLNMIKVRISGMGGQGILLVGYLLGKAAVEYDEIQACQTQSYGPEMRGSKCKSDVILVYTDQPIHCPAIKNADILVAMSQEAWNTYRQFLNDPCQILIDPDLVKIEPLVNSILPVPATKTADQLGNRIVANITMLGALIEITQIISKSAIQKAINVTIPKKLLTLNLKALNKGYLIGKNLIQKSQVE